MEKDLTTTQTTAIATVRSVLERSKGEIAKALPKHMTPDRMLRIAMTSIQKTPALLLCDVRTLIASIMEAAQLGLYPDGVTGEAYLIPFGKEAKLMIGYRGFIKLMYNSGQVASVFANVVYEKDDFKYRYGLNEVLEHVPSKDTDRGALEYAYAYAHFKDGGHTFVVLNRAEIMEHKAHSKTDKVWKSHESAMWLKTAVRVLERFCPKSSAPLQMAAQRDALREQGLDISIETVQSKTEGNVDELIKDLENAPETTPAAVAGDVPPEYPLTEED